MDKRTNVILTLFFCSMTLTQTEKGYPPPIEHIGIPTSIREEKGKLRKKGTVFILKTQ